ncbi:MAG: hypothetical protein FD124_1163 [Alphaproteobacteria bacterium]|nr:MAG: hypothetical protein FD124_1163 [Alphaproteobacteria bacterium]
MALASHCATVSRPARRKLRTSFRVPSSAAAPVATRSRSGRTYTADERQILQRLSQFVRVEADRETYIDV